MTEAGLQTIQPHANRAMSRDQIELLKTTICKGTTDDEMQLFVQVCERTNLDPFARQIFAVKRWDSKAQREVMAIQTSIDGFRLIAERSKNYAGQLGPFWSADGEKWVDVWLQKGVPAAAKVGVLRRGFKEPLWSVATWDQFCPMKDGKPMGLWNKLGPLMLAKCAESQALRRAFPHDLSGIYTEEEMEQTVNHEAELFYVWTDEQTAAAKACIADLADVVFNLGADQDEIKAILAKPAPVGDGELSYEVWDRRFADYAGRVTKTWQAKAKERGDAQGV